MQSLTIARALSEIDWVLQKTVRWLDELGAVSIGLRMKQDCFLLRRRIEAARRQILQSTKRFGGQVLSESVRCSPNQTLQPAVEILEQEMPESSRLLNQALQGLHERVSDFLRHLAEQTESGSLRKVFLDARGLMHRAIADPANRLPPMSMLRDAAYDRQHSHHQPARFQPASRDA